MPTASLELPEYPFHPSHAMREDPSLLARLLESYRKAAGTAENAAEFLFGYAPIHVIDEIFDSAGHASAEEEMPWAGHVWLMHVSGYFGGVWLRAEIRRDEARLLRGKAASQPGRVADLVAHEGRIQAVREWPFDAPSLMRFSLYLGVGAGSWLGAALVERLLSAALD